MTGYARVRCQNCLQVFTVFCRYTYDPGYRYNDNGDGLPESLDIEELDIPKECPKCTLPFDDQDVELMYETAEVSRDD